MPSDLISSYLADLRRRLPEGMVDDIADGLAEASEQHLARAGSARRTPRTPLWPNSETPGN